MEKSIRSGPTDPNTRALINALRKTSTKHDVGIWKRVAELVARPSRTRPTVNVGKIERHTNAGDIVVVPGKVLGSGNMSHKVTVAALNASYTARSAIVGAGGSLITIDELMKQIPKGSGIRIIV
ncbi:MAG: 50S ribosomal protein L18e [Candidatus Thorarchaeota archaeon]|nr:MAG: 50S ribosomal protein L18e [Candidatus Thorarchaeota archaeon]